MKIANIRSLTPAAPGNVDYTYFGFGTPTAAIVIINGATVDDVSNTHVIEGYGCTDGTRQWALGFKIAHNLATTSARSISNTSRIVCTTIKGAGDTVALRGAFVSWVTDGIRINFDTTTYQASITVILIQCDQAYAAFRNVSAAGNITVHEPNFRTDYIFGWTPTYLFPNSTSGYYNSIGFACRCLGMVETQASVGMWHQDTAPTSQGSNITRTDHIGCDPQNAAVTFRIFGYSAQGFSVQTAISRVSTHLWYLALRDDLYRGRTGLIQAPAAPGVVSYSGFDRRANHIFALSVGRTTLDTSLTGNFTNCLSWSVLGVNQDCSHTISTLLGVGTSNTASRIGRGLKLFDQNTVSAYSHVADLVSKDRDGFTLDFSTSVRNAYFVTMVSAAPVRNLNPIISNL